MSYALILAWQSRVLDMGQRFRSDAKLDVSQLGWGALLLGAAAVVIWLVVRQARQRDKGIFHSPRRLFGELCRAHGLDAASRRLLARLAAARGLPQPAALFLTPEHFDPARLPPALAAQRAGVERLRERLFGRGLADLNGPADGDATRAGT